MNTGQIISFVRTLMQCLGLGLVLFGWLKPEEVSVLGEQVTNAFGAVLLVGTTFYGLWQQRNAALIKRTATLPEVSQIITTSSKIAESAGPKVTADFTPPSVQ